MTHQNVRPPIPVRLAHLPTVGGLVTFRSTHRATWEKCWQERRCQVCALPLATPLVLLCGPNQLEKRLFDEPPLHPECAFYAQQACPMVAGRMPTYADRENVSAGRRGKTCPGPGCDCGGWVPDDGTPHKGEPAHPWYAVWVSGYQLAIRPDGSLIGGACEEHQVLRVRTVSTEAEVH